MARVVTRFSLEPSFCLAPQVAGRRSPSPRHSILHSVHSSSFISFPLSRPVSNRSSPKPPMRPRQNSRKFSPLFVRSSTKREAALTRATSVAKAGRVTGVTARVTFRKRLRERSDYSPSVRIHGVISHLETRGRVAKHSARHIHLLSAHTFNKAEDN